MREVRECDFISFTRSLREAGCDALYAGGGSGSLEDADALYTSNSDTNTLYTQYIIREDAASYYLCLYEIN